MPGRISNEELKSELQRLEAELGETPKIQDLKKHGNISYSTYRSRFGSWDAAIEAAGLDTYTRDRRISKDELIDALYGLADLLGETPTGEQMNERGEYSVKPYRDVFGGWNDALKESGFRVNKEDEIDKEELLSELERVYEDLGRVPTQKDMNEYGQYSIQPYNRCFESWTGALERLDLRHDNTPLTEEDIISDIIQTNRETGGDSITLDEYDEVGTYSSPVVTKKLGKWNNVLDTIGIPINVQSDIARDELINSIQELSDDMQRKPSANDIRASSTAYSVGAYIREFGSWSEALEAAEFEPNENPFNREQSVAGGTEFGDDWDEKRERALDRDDETCRVCSDSGELVHHIRPRGEYISEGRKGEMNELDNLVTLCSRCHGKYEWRWKDLSTKEWVDRAQSHEQF